MLRVRTRIYTQKPVNLAGNAGATSVIHLIILVNGSCHFGIAGPESALTNWLVQLTAKNAIEVPKAVIIASRGYARRNPKLCFSFMERYR